ncbi:MAG: MFS transporter [Acidobacteria bacterium]|jgi:PAT family beta-lactamase induction signal transducer AmpG|nr:MFS transporter [Acidobacteriota bacterium]
MNGKPPPAILKDPHVWCFSTYFAEGFPFSIIRSVSTFFFRDRGVSLEAVGLTTFFGLPWILKFFWGPLIDEFATKKRWLLAMQATLAVLIGATAFLVPLPGGVRLIAGLFFVGAFIAATHDIAIDGYYLAALDKQEQTKFLGYRVMAYRVAMLTGTGVIVTIGASFSWTLAFLLAGLLLGLLATYHHFFLPECEIERRPIGSMFRLIASPRVLLRIGLLLGAVAGIYLFFNSSVYRGWEVTTPLLKELNFPRAVGLGLLLALALLAVFRNQLTARLTRDPDSFYGRAFLTFMDQEKIGLVLAFVILARSGEFMVSSMSSAFVVDLGVKTHYGWISGGIGLPASIAGALIGGWMISRFGLRRLIWPFLLAQNLTNVAYMLLAGGLAPYLAANTGAAQPVFIGVGNLALTAGVHGFDQFASGLGTAVLTTFLMRICKSEHKAAHFAIGSGLMSLGGIVAGVSSGFIASWLGYSGMFLISFIISIPGMVLLFWVPKK